MKNDKNISFGLFSFNTVGTQAYIHQAHKLRGEAMAEHFGVIKNVFKRKSSAQKIKK